MRDYVATLRAGYQASDDATALIIAEHIAQLARDNALELEEGDEILVTQVIDFAPADVPQEIIDVLVKARNTLIKTRLSPMIDLARELDRVIFSLEHGDFDAIMPYDFSRMPEFIVQILKEGKAPIT